MAFYSNGRVIYYGYTDDSNSRPQLSTLLASSPASGHLPYQMPTMAFYINGRVIHYGYTAADPHGTRPAPRPVSHEYETVPQVPGPAISVVQPSRAGENPQPNTVKMRTTIPVADRESFEQEADRTKGTSDENQAALQSTPMDGPGFYKRANAYKQTGDYDNAIKDYGEVIRLDPDNAYAYYKRALCNTALQRMDLAIEDFRKANELMNGQQPAWNQPSHSRFPQQGY